VWGLLIKDSYQCSKQNSELNCQEGTQGAAGKNIWRGRQNFGAAGKINEKKFEKHGAAGQNLA
jgi:hypothetical protein